MFVFLPSDSLKGTEQQCWTPSPACDLAAATSTSAAAAAAADVTLQIAAALPLRGETSCLQKNAASACLWYRYGQIRFFIVQRGPLLPSGFVSHHRETSKGGEAFRRVFGRCLLVEARLVSGVTVAPQVPAAPPPSASSRRLFCVIYSVPRRCGGKIEARKQKPSLSAATLRWDRSISDGDVDAEGNCRLSPWRTATGEEATHGWKTIQTGREDDGRGGSVRIESVKKQSRGENKSSRLEDGKSAMSIIRSNTLSTIVFFWRGKQKIVFGVKKLDVQQDWRGRFIHYHDQKLHLTAYLWFEKNVLLYISRDKYTTGNEEIVLTGSQCKYSAEYYSLNECLFMHFLKSPKQDQRNIPPLLLCSGAELIYQ